MVPGREAAIPVSCKFFILPVLQQRMPFPFCFMLPVPSLMGGGGSGHKIQGKSTQGYLLSFKGGSPASPQKGNLALGCDERALHFLIPSDLSGGAKGEQNHKIKNETRFGPDQLPRCQPLLPALQQPGESNCPLLDASRESLKDHGTSLDSQNQFLLP